MAVRSKNPHWKLSEIKARHWIETARRCGIADMEAIVADLVSRTPAVIERLQAAIPKRIPGKNYGYGSRWRSCFVKTADDGIDRKSWNMTPAALLYQLGFCPPIAHLADER